MKYNRPELGQPLVGDLARVCEEILQASGVLLRVRREGSQEQHLRLKASLRVNVADALVTDNRQDDALGYLWIDFA
jgi:hypothetical protein